MLPVAVHPSTSIVVPGPFGPALFWTQNLTVGLLNFVASVPLVLFALAEVVRQSPSARGTQVERKSHQRPPVHSASLVQVGDDTQSVRSSQ